MSIEEDRVSRRDDNGQHVMVIGGSSGIGLGVARIALRSGATVTIVGRSQERLTAARAGLGATERLTTASADVTREDQVRALFESSDPLDHVVLTAADIVAYQPVRELDLTAARATIDSKLIAGLLVAKHAAPVLPPNGSITFTGGIATDRPAPGGAVVATVNSALSGLARGLALELAPIRVNVIAPGWVPTPVWDKIAGDNKHAVLDGMARRLPTGRLGSPEDIGEAVMFLTRARHLTAAVVPVDGGQRLV
jgi:NAD(P)-dependent dehydrogenase (short-subunit alcohol dehydrogenase family)